MTKHAHGRHPNSLKALEAHKRKPGDPPLEGAGRPRRPLTDPLADGLQERVPLTPGYKKFLVNLGLIAVDGANHVVGTLDDEGNLVPCKPKDIKISFSQAAMQAKRLRMLLDEGSYQDGRNAIEGSPVARQIVEQHDSGNLILHSRVEPAPPGFEHEPGPFERVSPLAQDTSQVNSK